MEADAQTQHVPGGATGPPATSGTKSTRRVGEGEQTHERTVATGTNVDTSKGEIHPAVAGYDNVVY